MKLTTFFKDFFESEKSSGLILLICTAISLLLANSGFQESYFSLLHVSFAGNTLTHWINEGLMSIFFLLIGFELERELYNGELSNKKNALLPFVGAIGGMLVPAFIYLLFNYNTTFQKGVAIPMATDIAFALAILSLLGSRISAALKIFIAALAVIDDIGAILIIAIFYSANVSWVYLFFVAAIWAFLFLLNRLKVHNFVPYLIGGVAMWYCMLHTGIHASITGIIMAFVIPFGNGEPTSLSYKLQIHLHKPVAFFILPLFALVNTAIVIQSNLFQLFTENYALGILLGLVVGKAMGIFSFCIFAIKIGICTLPKELKFIQLAAVSFLGGIGFTMSVFITMLAFNDETIINNAKLVIIIASLIAGSIGFVFLKLAIKKSSLKRRIQK